MVKKKDKAGVMPASTRTITATDVRIINGNFVDEEGNIAEKIADFIPENIDTFKITIKFDIADDEVDE